MQDVQQHEKALLDRISVITCCLLQDILRSGREATAQTHDRIASRYSCISLFIGCNACTYEGSSRRPCHTAVTFGRLELQCLKRVLYAPGPQSWKPSKSCWTLLLKAFLPFSWTQDCRRQMLHFRSASAERTVLRWQRSIAVMRPNHALHMPFQGLLLMLFTFVCAENKGVQQPAQR